VITLKLVGEHIQFCPESPIENELLINILPEEEGFYDKGTWLIHKRKIDIIRRKLITSQNITYDYDDAYKTWRNQRYKNAICIRCGVVTSKITRGFDAEAIIDIPHKKIEEATRYFWKPAVNNSKYKNGNWDGYINLYKRWEQTFPTGLIDDICRVLDEEKIKYYIDYIYELAPKRQFNWVVDDGVIPDPDQVNAVELALKGRRGILKAPTGFGKTFLLAKNIVARLAVPTLVVANKKTLLDDASNEFTQGIKGLSSVGCIKDGWFDKEKISTSKDPKITSPIIVATIQSLSARLEDESTRAELRHWLRNVCKLVIVDESQALGTKTWDEVMSACNAPYRFGLSATPKRTDGATIKLKATTGPILFTTTAEEQIQKGRLCDLRIYYQPFNHGLYNEHDQDLVYNDVYRAQIIENKDRNESCIVSPTLEMLEEERCVLVLIQYIEHGHILKDMFIRSGVNPDDIRFIWGETSDKIRQSAVAEFRKGAFKIMIGSTIFDAGVNIPVISGVVLAGAGNSDITLIQRIGRGARNCDYEDILGYMPEFMKNNHGKKITKVYDIMDTKIKFFHNQSLNRYYNARDEFGKDRVFLLGEDKSVLRRASKKTSGQSQISAQIDQMSAQLELLKEFSK
jgi:superfamily II DNA or RNA helicase